jgi:hypothetical protein
MKKNAKPKKSSLGKTTSARREVVMSQRERKELIQGNLDQILKDIKENVLVKYNMGHLNVAEIAFNELDGCPQGFELICKSFGNDPRTGQPIVKCKCVRKI